MAMSDCSKCQNTPCACGHDYQVWTPKARGSLILAVASSGPIVFGYEALDRFGRPSDDGMRAIDRLAAALSGRTETPQKRSAVQDLLRFDFTRLGSGDETARMELNAILENLI